MSAFVCGHGLSLGQLKTVEKSNEITAIPELIGALALQGSTVTLDAMGCQKEIAAAIVGKQAHYVLALKANHDTLYSQVKLQTTAPVGRERHGRVSPGPSRRGTTGWKRRKRGMALPGNAIRLLLCAWAGTACADLTT